MNTEGNTSEPASFPLMMLYALNRFRLNDFHGHQIKDYSPELHLGSAWEHPAVSNFHILHLDRINHKLLKYQAWVRTVEWRQRSTYS
jgi:hypothetical protein